MRAHVSRNLTAIAVALIAISAWGTSTRAGLVQPVSYDMPNGEGVAIGGAFNYWDETYNGSGSPTTDLSPLSGGLGQLTDGVLGGQDWMSDLGNGPAYEWVGWREIDPTITFNLGAVRDLSSVAFHANNAGTGGVALFGSVVLTFSNDGLDFGDAITYTTSAAERADTSARFTTVATPISAQYVRASFTDGDGVWVFLSEAQFEVVAVPEPGTLMAGVVGALTLAGAASRRKSR